MRAAKNSGLLVLGSIGAAASPSLEALEQFSESTVPVRDRVLSLEEAIARLQCYFETLKKEEEKLVKTALAHKPHVPVEQSQTHQWSLMRKMWIRANADIISFLARMPYGDQSKLLAWITTQAAAHRRWTIDGLALDQREMPTIALH